jgi:lysine 2,3-aminomutase
MPNYIISWSTNKVVLRNYEGVITTYQEPDKYNSIKCDRKCNKCVLQLKLERDDKTVIGIEKLLADADKSISLVPKGNLRLKRREKTQGAKAPRKKTTSK